MTTTTTSKVGTTNSSATVSKKSVGTLPHLLGLPTDLFNAKTKTNAKAGVGSGLPDSSFWEGQHSASSHSPSPPPSSPAPPSSASLDRRCAPLGNTFVNVLGELGHRMKSTGRCRSCPPHLSEVPQNEADDIDENDDEAVALEDQSEGETLGRDVFQDVGGDTSFCNNSNRSGKCGSDSAPADLTKSDREERLARASTTLESLQSSHFSQTNYSSGSEWDVSAVRATDAGDDFEEGVELLCKASTSANPDQAGSVQSSCSIASDSPNASDHQAADSVQEKISNARRGGPVLGASSGGGGGGPSRKTYADDPTTLMIRNLPHELRQQDLQHEVDDCGFVGSYDFLYLPTTVCTGMGKGYAFLNFRLPASAVSFSQLWHRKPRFGLPPGTLSVSPADVQGLQANLSLWDTEKNRRIRNPRFRPFVASDVVSGIGSATMAGSNSNASAYSTGSSCRSNHNYSNHHHHHHQHRTSVKAARQVQQRQQQQQLQQPQTQQHDHFHFKQYQRYPQHPQPQPQQRQYSWVMGRGGAAYAAPL